MARVRLEEIAHGRSGDKGDASNVGLIARSPESYHWMREHLSPEWVKQTFGQLVKGPVERYEVPNLLALNFILHDALGGGGSESLLTDAQGKTHAQGLLQVEVEVPQEVLDSVR
ncbi:MAG: AtuA-related protein [Thermoanaerobaculaceae bacterium]